MDKPNQTVDLATIESNLHSPNTWQLVENDATYGSIETRLPFLFAGYNSERSENTTTPSTTEYGLAGLIQDFQSQTLEAKAQMIKTSRLWLDHTRLIQYYKIKSCTFESLKASTPQMLLAIKLVMCNELYLQSSQLHHPIGLEGATTDL
jgi:hypothetical protein